MARLASTAVTAWTYRPLRATKTWEARPRKEMIFGACLSTGLDFAGLIRILSRLDIG